MRAVTVFAVAACLGLAASARDYNSLVITGSSTDQSRLECKGAADSTGGKVCTLKHPAHAAGGFTPNHARWDIVSLRYLQVDVTFDETYTGEDTPAAIDAWNRAIIASDLDMTAKIFTGRSSAPTLEMTFQGCAASFAEDAQTYTGSPTAAPSASPTAAPTLSPIVGTTAAPVTASPVTAAPATAAPTTASPTTAAPTIGTKVREVVCRFTRYFNASEINSSEMKFSFHTTMERSLLSLTVKPEINNYAPGVDQRVVEGSITEGTVFCGNGTATTTTVVTAGGVLTTTDAESADRCGDVVHCYFMHNLSTPVRAVKSILTLTTPDTVEHGGISPVHYTYTIDKANDVLKHTNVRLPDSYDLEDSGDIDSHHPNLYKVDARYTHNEVTTALMDTSAYIPERWNEGLFRVDFCLQNPETYRDQDVRFAIDNFRIQLTTDVEAVEAPVPTAAPKTQSSDDDFWDAKGIALVCIVGVLGLLGLAKLGHSMHRKRQFSVQSQSSGNRVYTG